MVLKNDWATGNEFTAADQNTVADEVNAKAAAADLTAETTARENADTTLAGDISTLDSAAEKVANKGAMNGYAGLDAAGTIPDGQIPAAIARDTEIQPLIDASINALIDGAPTALDTLNELAAALGDDADFAATMTSALADKQPLDTDLTNIAALTTTSFGRGLLELASSSAGRTALGLVIGTDVQAWDAVLDATTASFTTALETKLNGVEAGATANSSDATLLDRANHTGAQAISTVTDLQTELTALEAADTVIEPNVQTAAYTLVLTDAGKVVEMDVASANNLTVPPNSSVAFPVGTVIEVCQVGAGQTTIVAGTGVTIQTPETLVVTGQWSSVSLRKRATDEWVLAGDVEAAA